MLWVWLKLCDSLESIKWLWKSYNHRLCYEGQLCTIENKMFLFQRGEEPDPSAKAAAGWGLPGFTPCRSGEGAKEKGGAGTAEARRGEGPTERPCWGAETKSEFCSPFPLPVCTHRSLFKYLRCSLLGINKIVPWLWWQFLLWPQTLEEEKERKSECLPPEPPADDSESVKIVFKLPNDTRVERRFLFGQSLTVSTTVFCWRHVGWLTLSSSFQ